MARILSVLVKQWPATCDLWPATCDLQIRPTATTWSWVGRVPTKPGFLSGFSANTKRKWGDREGGSLSSPWDMSCPRKLFLDERKSSETSACRLTSVQCLKENIYSSAFHVRHHFLFSLKTWERGKTACGRLGRQTSARTMTSTRLKITFVDITYPGQRPEPPSLSPHFLLQILIVSQLRWPLFD